MKNKKGNKIGKLNKGEKMQQKTTKNNKKLKNTQNSELQKKSATKKNAVFNNNNNSVTSTDIKDCKLLDIKEVSKILNVSRFTVAHLFKQKHLGYIVVSKQKKVWDKDLLEYIKSRRIAPLVGSF